MNVAVPVLPDHSKHNANTATDTKYLQEEFTDRIPEEHVSISNIEKEAAENQTQELHAEEPRDTEDKIPNAIAAEPDEEEYNFFARFKAIKPFVNKAQGGLVVHNYIAHTLAVVTNFAKIFAAKTGTENFLSKHHDKITGYAGFMGRLDGVPTTLSGLADLSDKSKFPVGLSKMTSILKSISFVNSQMYSGFYTLVNGFHSIWHNKALETGITDKLSEPEEDTNWGHVKKFVKDHIKVLNDSRKLVMDELGKTGSGEKTLKEVLGNIKVQQSIMNIFYSFSATVPTLWGLSFCHGDYLKTVPNKIMKSFRSFGLLASSVMMIKMNGEKAQAVKREVELQKNPEKAFALSEEQDKAPVNKGKEVLDKFLGSIAIGETFFSAATGWLEDIKLPGDIPLVKMKAHFIASIVNIINFGYNNYDKVANFIDKKLSKSEEVEA